MSEQDKAAQNAGKTVKDTPGVAGKSGDKGAPMAPGGTAKPGTDKTAKS